MKRPRWKWLFRFLRLDPQGQRQPLPASVPVLDPRPKPEGRWSLRIDLEQLRGRPSPALELLLTLQQARRRKHRAEGEIERVAFQVIEAAWGLERAQAPAALVADLVAEAWGLLAEEALAQGTRGRSGLALALAEAAAHEGSGDASLAAQQHAAWALHFWQAGRLEDARQELAELALVAHGIDDREAQAEAALWSWLLARHEGREGDAEEALREATHLLAPKPPAEVLARLEARMNRLGIGAPPTEPAPRPEPAPGPIANGTPPKPAPDPSLEDTWEEPRPKRRE